MDKLEHSLQEQHLCLKHQGMEPSYFRYIHRRYGGADAILSIYETYNDYGASISESKLRDVITLGIQNTGTTEGFGATYRAMASYLYSTSTWLTI